MSGNNWRKSTCSGGEGGECIEVGQANGILIRDTKDHDTGPVLRFTPAQWKRFTRTVVSTRQARAPRPRRRLG